MDHDAINLETLPLALRSKVANQLDHIYHIRQMEKRADKETIDKLKQAIVSIHDLIFAEGAPLGSNAYFEIRKICVGAAWPEIQEKRERKV